MAPLKEFLGMCIKHPGGGLPFLIAPTSAELQIEDE